MINVASLCCLMPVAMYSALDAGVVATPDPACEVAAREKVLMPL
jgi:hypothetical protein